MTAKTLKKTRGWIKRKKSVTCAAERQESEGNIPFPFDEADYLEVAMQLLKPMRTSKENNQATLVLYHKSGIFLDLFQMQTDKSLLSKLKDEKCLVVEIGGDTVFNISAAVESAQFLRPLALDLLWKVLQRGQQLSKKEWAIVRVAIVDLRDGTFIGRLFFGDRDSGIIYWDCDCRPSDGIWLALQSQCPVYVHKNVWNVAAVPLAKLVVNTAEEKKESKGKKDLYTKESEDMMFPLLGLKKDDPEPIKRLKRELQVALSEEDYTAAIRIRDHPFMQLYSKMETQRNDGNLDEAMILGEELSRAIKESGEGEED